MKVKSVVIVGAGPRGLAVALQLAKINNRIKRYQITLVDPTPLRSWDSTSVISNIEMRSPSSFDLVTFIPNMEPYSLNHYLGIRESYNTQQEVEECPHRVQRSDFYGYLESIYQVVLSQSMVSIIRDSVINILPDTIELSSGETIGADYIVLALGTNGYNSKPVPYWLSMPELDGKLINPTSTILEPPVGKNILIIGSGQGAHEYVDYLAPSNQVYHFLNQIPTVSSYPVPVWRDWGHRSSLGNYYNQLPSSQRERYLMEIKASGPTITHYINERLQTRSYIRHVPSSIKSSIGDLSTIDSIISITGSVPTIDKLPLRNIRYARNPYSPSLPMIEKGFKLPGSNIYITGPLALRFDGPRQNSLISAGLTAREIVRSITKL